MIRHQCDLPIYDQEHNIINIIPNSIILDKLISILVRLLHFCPRISVYLNIQILNYDFKAFQFF